MSCAQVSKTHFHKFWKTDQNPVRCDPLSAAKIVLKSCLWLCLVLSGLVSFLKAYCVTYLPHYVTGRQAELLLNCSRSLLKYNLVLLTLAFHPKVSSQKWNYYFCRLILFGKETGASWELNKTHTKWTLHIGLFFRFFFSKWTEWEEAGIWQKQKKRDSEKKEKRGVVLAARPFTKVWPKQRGTQMDKPCSAELWEMCGKYLWIVLLSFFRQR